MSRKVKNFEDLAVYQKTRNLAGRIYSLTRQPAFAKDYGLADQIRRAAVSIISNIAEGFERSGNPELIQFLYVAKGSCGEVRAQLMIACDQQYIDKPTYESLVDESRRVSAMLSNLIGYLKKSGCKGSKYKNCRIKPLNP
jgi:four helix bundle protein